MKIAHSIIFTNQILYKVFIIFTTKPVHAVVGMLLREIPLWSSTPNCRGKVAPTLFFAHDTINVRELYSFSLQYRLQIS
jgi:hypothetical protein